MYKILCKKGLTAERKSLLVPIISFYFKDISIKWNFLTIIVTIAIGSLCELCYDFFEQLYNTSCQELFNMIDFVYVLNTLFNRIGV